MMRDVLRRRGTWARSPSNCRCRPALCRRCGTRTSACARVTSPQFPGYYQSGDAGLIDEDGYVFVMGRTDDIINVAGHRLSTGGIEEVLASHPDVAECAVIGMADPLKGEVPVRLSGAQGRRGAHAGFSAEARRWRSCANRIGPVASFKLALAVDRLPKTRSGKILRGTMKKIADREAWTMPATIEDPTVLDEIARALEAWRKP